MREERREDQEREVEDQATQHDPPEPWTDEGGYIDRADAKHRLPDGHSLTSVQDQLHDQISRSESLADEDED